MVHLIYKNIYRDLTVEQRWTAYGGCPLPSRPSIIVLSHHHTVSPMSLSHHFIVRLLQHHSYCCHIQS